MDTCNPEYHYHNTSLLGHCHQAGAAALAFSRSSLVTSTPMDPNRLVGSEDMEIGSKRQDAISRLVNGQVRCQNSPSHSDG